MAEYDPKTGLELKEEGQPELLDDPEFDAHFQADLVEIGIRFGLNPPADSVTPEGVPADGRESTSERRVA